MNARETNRPGGRNRQRINESAAGDEQVGEGCFGCVFGCLSRIFSGCLLVVAALGGVGWLTADVVWGMAQ